MNRAAVSALLTLTLAACSSGPEPAGEAAASSSAGPARIVTEETAQEEPVLEGDAWYRNERFGFALQLPPFLRNPGSCILPNPPAAGSRVTAFEDGSSVYLGPDTYGEAVLRDPGDPSSGHDCLVIENTLPTIQKVVENRIDYPYGWRMSADESIGTDDQLLAFIRAWYGEGCTIGEKTPTAFEGTLEVAIDGAADCAAGADYELRYSPEKSTAVTWKTGRDARFNGQDGLMSDTFRFE